MMRNKSWAVLVGVAIVLGGAAWWVTSSRNQASEADFTPKPMFPGLTAKVNDVDSLEIATPKALFRIEKGADSEHWTMPGHAGYPVQADLVRKNVLGIAGLETIEPRSDKPENYDLLQVADPEHYKPVDKAAESDPGPVLIRLVGKDAKPIAAVIVGKTKSYPVEGKPGQYLVRKPDEARAWVARGMLDAKADPIDWLVKDLIKIDRNRVAEASVRQPDGETLALVRAPKTDKDAGSANFTPSEPLPKGMKISSQYDVNAVAGVLSWMTFDDVAKAADHDFSKATVTDLKTLDGVHAVIRSIPAMDKDGKDDKKAWITIAVTYDPALLKPDAANPDLLKPDDAQKQVKEAAARMDGWAYLVPESERRDLTRHLKDLLEADKPEDKKDAKKAG
ncbi:DUF4340 domain-containing protein [Ferrovibrio xuzhouensis]|uniref:DUF4340 domain-containing protein n=1 Tax=Ferrovibrio xuzhouensis TaxID=1576914 RepID=A0ABV7VBF5_9PROT